MKTLGSRVFFQFWNFHFLYFCEICLKFDFKTANLPNFHGLQLNGDKRRLSVSYRLDLGNKKQKNNGKGEGTLKDIKGH
jgi:hypothetical protein